jgi:hypothetical protein
MKIHNLFFNYYYSIVVGGLLLVLAQTATAQNSPVDRIQRGDGRVLIDGTGDVQIRPRTNAGLTIFPSTTTPPPSLPNTARIYYDPVNGVLRMSTNGGSYVLLSNPGSGPGTVSSVGLAMPTIFSVTGSPVTTSGTLTAGLVAQPANTFFGGAASGANAVPAFRLLVPADIPSLDVAKIGSGVFSIARGGTGLSSYTFGNLLYADGTGLLARLPGNTLSTRRYLSMTGDSTFAGVPAWSGIELGSGTAGGITGTLPVNNGGTGLSSSGSSNQLLGVNGAATGLVYKTLTAGSNVSISNTDTNITISATGTLSGDFQASDGTAATPGYRFGADTDTGLFRPADNALGMATGGIERARLNVVGFGVNTTPTFGIHSLGSGARVQALATPAQPTVTPNATGTTTYSYYIVARDGAGNRTLVSPVQTITNGAATPNNTITWAAVPGAVSYDVLKNNTSTLLATVTVTTLTDTGQATSALAAPTRNATADVTVDGNLFVGGALQGVTTALTIAQGGTGAATAAGAVVNLGAVSKTGDVMSGNLQINLPAGTAGTVGAATPMLTIRSTSQLTVDNFAVIEARGNDANPIERQYGKFGYKSAYDGAVVYGNFVVAPARDSVFTERFTINGASGNGNFTNNLNVTGSLSKGSGTFLIDHPKPELATTTNLYHGFVEAPFYGTMYKGRVQFANSTTASVSIDEVSRMSPGTFVLLNQEVDCYATNKTGFTPVICNVVGGELTITAQSAMSDTVSFLIVGERADAFIKTVNNVDARGRLVPEQPKSEASADLTARTTTLATETAEADEPAPDKFEDRVVTELLGTRGHRIHARELGDTLPTQRVRVRTIKRADQQR